jgi:uncharacterized protein YjbJ (UPF0337 family)
MNDRFEGAARAAGGRVQETIGDALGDAKLQADGFVNRATGRAQQAMGQAEDAASRLSDMVRAQPLLATAMAIGIGYLLGRARG